VPASEQELPFGIGAVLGGFDALGAVGLYGVTTAAGLALFFILVRRRRDTEESAPLLMAAAIPGVRESSTPAPIPDPAARSNGPAAQESGGTGDAESPWRLPSMRELVPPIDYDLLGIGDDRPGPAPHEAGIPRWLRPSVRRARFGEEPRRRRDWGD
jgi:hypothetical protein